MTRPSNGEAVTQERQGVERAESAITQSPSNASPFLKELDSITGPNAAAGSATRAMDKMDRDGFTGRAEALQASNILGDKSYAQQFWNGLTRTDVEERAKKTGISDGERALTQRLLKDFDKISGDGQHIYSSDITKFAAREQQHADLRNFYAKDPASGKSLYDSVRDSGGNVSAQKLDDRLKDPALSAQDRASLQAVNNMRSMWGGDLSQGALQRAGDAAGLTTQERLHSTKRPEPVSAEAQAGQAALNDLTAKPGGGRSLLDRISDGSGGLSLTKINDLAKYPERNNLTAKNVETLKYLQGHAPMYNTGDSVTFTDYSKADLQKLAADSGTNWDKVSGRPQSTRLDDVSRGRQEDFAHLFDKQLGKPSLYERMKGPDGGITNSRIDQELRDPALSPKDRHTLDYIKGLSRDGIILGRKDLTAADLIDQAHQHNVADRALQRGGLDPTQPVRPDVVAPQTNGGDLSPQAHAALKVKSGEGYYHIAESLIAAAHPNQRYDASQAELRSVVKQLKAANGNRSELNRGEELVVDSNLRSNPALAGLFR